MKYLRDLIGLNNCIEVAKIFRFYFKQMSANTHTNTFNKHLTLIIISLRYPDLATIFGSLTPFFNDS